MWCCHKTDSQNTISNSPLAPFSLILSEMNVSFPKPGSTDGELQELPIPEQFIHMLQLSDSNKPKVSTKVSDLYS